MNTDYITPKEACRRLGVCPRTLRRLIEAGQVQAVDIRGPGGKYAILRIRPESLHDPSDPAERLALDHITRGLGW